MRLKNQIFMGLTVACLIGGMTGATFAQQAPPAEGDEAQLIAVLKSEDAPLFDKAKACQQLAMIGTKAAVPVLAGLLGDEKMGHYARYGLEPIPDASVDAALAEASGKLKGGLLIGVINSIAMRDKAESVDNLKKLLGHSDVEVAAAAAAAMGRIHTSDAVAALTKALGAPASQRPAIAAACLTAGDMLLGDGKKTEAAAIYDAVRAAELPKRLRIAGTYGAIRARGAEGLPLLMECLGSDDKLQFRIGLRMAQELPGAEVTRALIEILPKLAPPAGTVPEPLVITKAEYGANDKWVDVTNKLAVAGLGGGLSVTSGNHLAGDPIHGVAKQLKVDYVLDGKEHSVTVPEGKPFQVKSDAEAPYPRQALVVYVLGARGDKSALPAVLEMATSGSAHVRVPAVRVLAELGDVGAVPVLLKAAARSRGLLAAAAGDSLADLGGPDVDAKLESMLAASEGRKQLVLIDLAGRRGISSAMPTLLKLADSDDAEIRAAAIGSLGLTVGPDQLSTLIDRLVSPKAPDVAPAAKEALRKACLRMPDRDAGAAVLIESMDGASTRAKVDLLDLLGVVGGGVALEGVSAATGDADEAIQDAATRVLGGWMSADVAPVLLELAKTGNDKFKVRCLRGYLRVARQLKVPNQERIKMSSQALDIAERDDEKRLAFEILARYPTGKSLSLVVPYLDNDSLKKSAAAAAVVIAENVVDRIPKAVATAMAKASEATDNRDVAARAKALQDRAEAKLGNR
jgi:HEAT repeat protein